METFNYKDLKKTNYFEGWYLRFSNNNINYAVIFAITKNETDPHAFLQIFDNTSEVCEYIKYPYSEFSYDYLKNEIKIANNTLSLNNLSINEENYQFELSFSNTTNLFDINNNKSSMGYLSKVPLQCFQEVIYLDGNINGSINNTSFNGKLYIEKTYGSRFPVKWIWLQSNHSKKGSSLSFSVGKIPFFGIKAKGFLAVLYADNKLYHFYTGNFSKLKIKDNNISVTKGSYRLVIQPTASTTIKLVGPTTNALMNGDVFESLTSKASIKLYYKNKIIFEDEYTNVGYENMW